MALTVSTNREAAAEETPIPMGPVLTHCQEASEAWSACIWVSCSTQGHPVHQWTQRQLENGPVSPVTRAEASLESPWASDTFRLGPGVPGVFEFSQMVFCLASAFRKFFTRKSYVELTEWKVRCLWLVSELG